ncbi:MAG: hypothetical protein GXC94_12790 [Comamonadaceae bacterium]|nr:hypothetical protein [Comamonadaceae bacterium]
MTLRRVVTAGLLAFGAVGVGAYVGELSKDSPADQVDGLPPLAERHRAYRTMTEWTGTAKPETPMTADVMRAYRLLKDADEQVLMATHQRFLDQTLEGVRRKLTAPQRQRIAGYRVYVTAAFDGAAKVDRTDRTILIPVDFLHDVWTTSMALDEMEAMNPPRLLEGGLYIAARVNPWLRAQRSDQTYLAQGFTQVLTGHRWEASREKWNDAMWNAYGVTRGAALHQALHELCHVLLEHKDYGEISSQGAMTQEREADACAYRLMPDRDQAFFNPGGALMVLMNRAFNAAGEVVTSRTHPPALCRARSLAAVMPGGRGFERGLDGLIDMMLQGPDGQVVRQRTRKALAACGS